MIRLTLLAALCVVLDWWTAAAILCLPLAYRAGCATTARRNGLAMVCTGTRRVVTGRL